METNILKATRNLRVNLQQKHTLSIFYFLIFTSLGLLTGIMGPSLPTFAKNTTATLSQLSTLFIFSSLGFMAGAYLSGLLLQKMDGHLLLVISITVLATGVALLPVIRSLWILVGLLFLLGIIQGSLDVGENTLLIWLHGNQVAPFMNGLHSFYGIGSFVAPLFIAQSLRFSASINPAFWIISVIILFPALFLWRFPAPQINSSAGVAERSNQKQPLWLILFLLFFFFGYAGAEITFGNWIYTYSIKMGFNNAEQAAYLTSLFWGIFTLSRLLSIFVAKKLSSKTILTINLCGGTAALVLMIVFANQAFALWVGTAMFSFFIASTFPTAMNLAGELGAVSSKITSLIFVFSSFSGMITPWLTGQWIEGPNPVITLWFVLADFLLAIVMFGLITIFQKSSKQKI